MTRLQSAKTRNEPDNNSETLAKQKMPTHFFTGQDQIYEAYQREKLNQYVAPPTEGEIRESWNAINFSTFTREDKVKQNILKAGQTAKQNAVIEARRIKREHLKSAIAQKKPELMMTAEELSELADLQPSCQQALGVAGQILRH